MVESGEFSGILLSVNAGLLTVLCAMGAYFGTRLVNSFDLLTRRVGRLEGWHIAKHPEEAAHFVDF